MRTLARTSLYFFQRGVLNDQDLIPDFHGELCAALQGLSPYFPHAKKLFCGFRGSLKTSGLRAFLLWMGLNSFEESNAEGVPFIPNFSTFYIEQKYENAEAHHEMLQEKFRTGPQAGLLCDLYRDRLDGAMNRWTKKRTYLVQTDPNEEPFITVGSLDAKLEGGHKHMIACDDLEGADADTSDVPNREARRFVYDRAPHLLKERYRGLIYIFGTPHGAEPLVWTIREEEGGGTLDNGQRKHYHIWWKGCLNQDDKSEWEERFPTENLHLERQLAEQVGGDLKRGWDTQMDLKKHSAAAGIIDMERLASCYYRAEYVRLQGQNRMLLFYEKEYFRQAPEGIAKDLPLERSRTQIDVEALRIYLHADPGHKDPEERISDAKPSKWAVLTVGIAPDWHAFVIECWIRRNVEYDDFLNEWLRQYRRWCPRVDGSCTFDPVGAQTWFRHDLRHLEQWKFHNRIYSLPTPWRKKPIKLARPSTRIADAHKTGRSKVEHISQQLQPQVNFGWLHLRTPDAAYQDDTSELIEELGLLGKTDKETFDGCDALAQGPPVWVPPPSAEAIKAAKFRNWIRNLAASREVTGYDRPWKPPAPPPMSQFSSRV